MAYEPHVWVTDEIITAERLNEIEDELGRLSTLTDGNRFVDSLNTRSYLTEGCFNNPNFDIHNIEFVFSDEETEGSARCNTQFLMRARSNII